LNPGGIGSPNIVELIVPIKYRTLVLLSITSTAVEVGTTAKYGESISQLIEKLVNESTSDHRPSGARTTEPDVPPTTPVGWGAEEYQEVKVKSCPLFIHWKLVSDPFRLAPTKADLNENGE
jgi:hypothetical protein